ncbi:MAG TPA: hypothetical protein VD978_08415 [Azospirillum sp.]|nr:hypothetical protein [Azospirillum sp.]
MKLKPFADDERSISIGDLTVENGTDRVALYGSLDITRDKEGLRRARDLLALAQAAVTALEAAGDLPDRLPPPSTPEVVKNPFQ